MMRFWESYPAHRRTANFKRFIELWNLYIGETQGPAACAALDAYKETPEWQSENGRYIPGMARFIEEKRWTSTPKTKKNQWIG